MIKKVRKKSRQSGQTLVALLAFMGMAIMVTTTATAITLVNSQATGKFGTGETAQRLADDGVENAMLQLLRDPAYVGETLTLTDGTTVVTVSGAATKTITSVGTSNTVRRTVQATATYSGNIITLTSWTQVF